MAASLVRHAIVKKVSAYRGRDVRLCKRKASVGEVIDKDTVRTLLRE